MRRDVETSDNGTVSIEIRDTDIVVGSRYCMTVRYTAGRQGVSVGGNLRFRLPGLNLKGNNRNYASMKERNDRASLHQILGAAY